MSPEQARGLAVDQRADVWAFGCVLYELLTGRSPFRGDTMADTLSHVLHREPNWAALPAATPPPLRTLLRRCLEKNPQDRLPHIGSARLEIADAITSRSFDRPEPASRQVAEPPGRRHGRWVLTAGVAAAAVAAIAMTVPIARAWLARSRPVDSTSPTAVTRVSLDPEPGESWVISPHDPDFAISPSGDRIVYIARREGRNHVVVRRLDEFEGVSLGDFDGVIRDPFFSPDGEWVGFVEGNALKKAAVGGGSVLTVCALPGYMNGASWASDGAIIFGSLSGGLRRVPSSGGEPELLAREVQAEPRTGRWPDVLPDSSAVLFASVDSRGVSEIRVRSLQSGDEKLLVPEATFPRYSASGHLLYVADGLLWAVRFDVSRLEVVGDPVPVVDGVMIKGPRQTGMGAANVGIAHNGTLVYRPSGAEGGGTSTLAWVARDGREEPLRLPPRAYGRMQLSPDGDRLAIEITDISTGNTDVWVGDPHGETLSQVTFDPAADVYPVWTPDGQRLLYRSDRSGGGLYWTRADGTGTEERLFEIAHATPYFVTSDGAELVFADPITPERSLFGLSLGAAHTVRKLGVFPGPVAALSPDGRWLANSSEETGDFEVYVQPLQNPDKARWRISTGGGRDPVWSRDGRELFYQRDTSVLSSSITTEPMFAAAPAVTLFEGAYIDSTGRWYDVASDGRFLMIKPGWLAADRQAPLHVVLGWFGELDRRVSGR
jgi:serine/threonine-protein kinase